MKVLITGAAGYIGSHLANHLLGNTSHELVLADLKDQTNSNGSEIRKIDLSDHSVVNDLFKNEHFDAVVHLAALINDQLSVKEPLRFYATNVSNTIHLLQLCSQYNVNNFVFLSSAAVYQHDDQGFFNESSPKAPLHPYGRSKLICEGILEDTSAANEEFEYVALRPFIVVCGGGRPELDVKATANNHPIKIAAQAALGKREKMVIFGDQYDTRDGTCIRDYVHVEDLCRQASASLDYLSQGNNSRAFNCGTSEGYSLKELCNTMKVVSGVDFEVEIGAKRSEEYPSMVADISQAQDLLGWRPEHSSLEELCKVTFDLEVGLS